MTEVEQFIEPQPAAEAQAAFDARWAAVDDVTAQESVRSRLPALPDPDIDEVFARVEAAERRLVAPHLKTEDYGEGTAQHADELRILWAGARLLVGADHATDPVRKATGRREAADHGTAGLAAVLAEDGVADAVIPVGRQTGNATVTPDHPYRSLVGMLAPGRDGVLSLHGMQPGLALDVLDEQEIHGLIGLGKHEPSERTTAAAEALVCRAKDELGLRVVISNHQPHLVYQNDPQHRPGSPIQDKINRVKVDERGEYVRGRLAALGENSTTNALHRAAPNVPSYQLELSRSLRRTTDDQFTRDRKKLAVGVYLGYRLSYLALKIMAEQAA
jgi:hypothetical protein